MGGKEYSVNYKCGNCYGFFLVRIPFKQEALQNLECPFCGLDAVRKTEISADYDGVCRLENERLVWIHG